MTFKIDIQHLFLLVRCLSCADFSEFDGLHFYTQNGLLYLSAGKHTGIICNTTIETDAVLNFCVSGKEFISYITYLRGFKTESLVELRMLEDSLGITYNDENIKNYIYLPHLITDYAKIRGFRVLDEYEFSTETLKNKFSFALAGTSSSAFSGSYNGVILANKDSTCVAVGTDSVKCAITTTDIGALKSDMPIGLTTTAVQAMINISKYLDLPCIFTRSQNNKKFKAVFGNVVLTGPLLADHPPVDKLFGLSGTSVIVDKSVLLQALRGAVSASAKDPYRGITIELGSSSLRLFTDNFELIVKCEVDGDLTSVKVNVNNLYTLLSTFSDDNFSMEFCGSPTVILHDDNNTAYLAGMVV